MIAVENQSHFVYRWTNNINGKWYIGSHSGDLDDGYTASGIAINKAFDKYGMENFSREILMNLDVRDDMLELEEFLLTELDASNNQNSYNLKNAAVGGRTSATWTKDNKPKPRKWTKEQREQAQATRKSRKAYTFKPTIIDGLEFKSRTEAAKYFNCANSTITRFVANGGKSYELRASKANNRWPR